MGIGSPVVEWVSDADGFASLSDEWNSLLPIDSTPFDLHKWYASWWEGFGSHYELFTRVLNQDGVLVAEFKRLVLVPRREPYEGTS